MIPNSIALRHRFLFIQTIFVWFIFISGYAQQYKFYDVDNGLSSSRINSILQDSEGYIWVATEDGLNRFDGSHFVIYRNIPDDSTSLPNNYIKSICEDSKHRFWVTTMSGLCLYDKVTDRFSRYKILSQDKTKEFTQLFYLMVDHQGYVWISVSGNGVICIDADKEEYTYFNTVNSGICSDHINVIYEDRFGNIWLGSGRDGISIYNPNNKTFRTFRNYTENENGISSNAISSICEDNSGNVWIGTLTGGVNIYSFANQSFSIFNRPGSSNKDEIGSLLRDQSNNIWIGTMGNGFEIYSTTTQSMLDVSINAPYINFNETKIQTLYEDHQGNIWIGCFQKGLFMIPKEKSLFTNYSFNPFAPEETIGNGAVQPILEDSQSDIWLGLDAGGVYRLDKYKKVRKHYKIGSEDPIPGNIVLSLYEDKEQNIWLGTYLNGAVRYNRKKDLFDLSLKVGKPPYGLLSTHVADFKEDEKGDLWIITNGGGINIYNKESKTFRYITHNDLETGSNQLIDNWCNLMYIGQDSLYWIATYRGLCTFDKRQNKYVYYTVENGKLPNNIVLTLKQDKKGNMWVGTQDGLACIDSSHKKIRIFNIKEGLPNSIINGIDEDNNGNLWISTNYGLSMYDPEKNKFTNYTTADGLLTNEFNRNAFIKTSDNEFIAGTIKGFTCFTATDVKQEQTEPLNLIFSNLYIFNQQIKVENQPGSVLKKTLNHTRKLLFSYNQNSFSIEFSALEYAFPEKIHYEVTMQGFDKTWLPVQNKTVTYTNLSPATYTLMVRAWRNNKEKGLVKQLEIQVLPPIWATWWAKGTYFMILLILGYMAYRYTKERLHTKRQEQLIQDKLQFFTDISHEIRTPLTLILSPLSKLISQNKDVVLTQTYNTMYKNGIRLLQLVNQIMDLRALEFGKKRLHTEKTEIISFLQELKNSFNNLAEEKNLAYTFQTVPEVITGYIDPDIITKILFNLISNAFKYTEKGTVSVSVKVTADMLIITIEDTGKGISPDQQALIFERFYIINGKHTSVNSSGIGLHLTRKLVELHHGAILLKSEPGKGSRFQITVPYQRKDFREDEINVSVDTIRTKPELGLSINTVIQEQKNPAKTVSNTHISILIAEDNADIRNLLLTELGNDYHIMEAVNGKEALLLALEKKPTLIISDILMPEMNGIEFCEKIRNNEQTRDIPFIMVTARTSMEQQIEGLEHGADAYITKPFDIHYLQATIERLIASRENLRKKYTQLPTIHQTEVPLPSQDDKLLNKLNEVIDKYLDNPELSVDILCKELGLSRTHLNRKMKDLTGESPASYIRQIRLQKSTRLLKSKSLTISEIAFTVGFSSPSYFSQAFRDYYGVTPKEFISSEKE